MAKVLVVNSSPGKNSTLAALLAQARAFGKGLQKRRGLASPNR